MQRRQSAQFFRESMVSRSYRRPKCGDRTVGIISKKGEFVAIIVCDRCDRHRVEDITQNAVDRIRVIIRIQPAVIFIAWKFAGGNRFWEIKRVAVEIPRAGRGWRGKKYRLVADCDDVRPDSIGSTSVARCLDSRRKSLRGCPL